MKKLDIFHIVLVGLCSVILLGLFVAVFIYKKELDCSDFKTQLEAQYVFEKYTQDVYQLDADEDLKACEAL